MPKDTPERGYAQNKCKPHSERCMHVCVCSIRTVSSFNISCNCWFYSKLHMLIVKTRKWRKNKGDNEFHILISYQHFLPDGLYVHICSFLHMLGGEGGGGMCFWCWERVRALGNFFYWFEQAPILIILISSFIYFIYCENHPSHFF